MPSALYAISYKATASVVALCSLEQQELPDAPAWARILKGLVGDGLSISLSTSGGPFEIPANELGCDRVRAPSQQELEAVLAEPYKFQVSRDPDDGTPPRPGDGQEKVLQRANRNAVQAIALMLGREGPAQVRVTLALPVSEDADPRLLFEGGLATRSPTPRGAAPSAELFFTLGNDVTVNAGASYGVMFFLRGAPVEARSVRAAAAAAVAAAAAPAASVAATAPTATANAPNPPNPPKVG